MANIKVELTEPLVNGMDIKFKAPCDCTAISGLIVYYPLDDGSGTGNQTFVFKDAHGNTLAGIGNLFVAGVVVKVVVDVETGAAYIQNADTNKYLEGKIDNCVDLHFTPINDVGEYDGAVSKVGKIVTCTGKVMVNNVTDVTLTMGMGDGTSVPIPHGGLAHIPCTVVTKTGAFVADVALVRESNADCFEYCLTVPSSMVSTGYLIFSMSYVCM